MNITRTMLTLAVLLFTTSTFADECKNNSGVWNVDGVVDPDHTNYSEKIEQSGCLSLKIFKHLKVDNKLKTEVEDIKISDLWFCELGTTERLMCVKARWRTPNDLLISHSVFEEGCLYVSDTYFEETNIMRTDNSRSCPMSNDNDGSFIRLTRVVSSKK